MGNVAEAAIRRDGDFVAVDVDARGEYCLAIGKIDEQRRMFVLIGDEKESRER